MFALQLETKFAQVDALEQTVAALMQRLHSLERTPPSAPSYGAGQVQQPQQQVPSVPSVSVTAFEAYQTAQHDLRVKDLQRMLELQNELAGMRDAVESLGTSSGDSIGKVSEWTKQLRVDVVQLQSQVSTLTAESNAAAVQTMGQQLQALHTAVSELQAVQKQKEQQQADDMAQLQTWVHQLQTSLATVQQSAILTAKAVEGHQSPEQVRKLAAEVADAGAAIKNLADLFQSKFMQIDSAVQDLDAQLLEVKETVSKLPATGKRRSAGISRQLSMPAPDSSAAAVAADNENAAENDTQQGLEEGSKRRNTVDSKSVPVVHVTTNDGVSDVHSSQSVEPNAGMLVLAGTTTYVQHDDDVVPVVQADTDQDSDADAHDEDPTAAAASTEDTVQDAVDPEDAEASPAPRTVRVTKVKKSGKGKTTSKSKSTGGGRKKKAEE